MTTESLISATAIAKVDRYTNERLPITDETLTRDDADPVLLTFDPDPVEGEWNDDHTFCSAELNPSCDAVFACTTFSFASAFDPGSSSNRLRRDTTACGDITT